MRITPSPAAFHLEQRLAQFHAMQRQIHALAAQLRALPRRDRQDDPLARLQAERERALDTLQAQFGDSVQVAAHRPPGASR